MHAVTEPRPRGSGWDPVWTALLGVDPSLIQQHTAVSEAVAIAMAKSARERTGSTWALSITGYAGPDGGTDENPVGTVYLGLAGPAGVQARRFNFISGRERIRSLAATTALDWLRRRMVS